MVMKWSTRSKLKAAAMNELGLGKDASFIYHVVSHFVLPKSNTRDEQNEVLMNSKFLKIPLNTGPVSYTWDRIGATLLIKLQ